MMTTVRKLTPKEIRMINYLLDGQLSTDKAKQAFLMIEQDKVLRNAYAQLRWTKSLLRQAPRRKVPHNFTLTREMAREATGFYKLRRQTFSIAGALASFLFVVLLAVQLVPLGVNLFLPTMMKSEDIAMMDEAAMPELMQAAPAADAEEPEMLAMEALPVEEEVAVEESAAEEPMSAAPAEEEVVEPEATLSPEEAAGGGGTKPEEEAENIAAADAVDEAAEERIIDEESEQELEEDAAIMLGEANDEAATFSEDELAKVDPEQTQAKTRHDWLFTATVMAGLLGFVFIFISIRDKNRENLSK